MMVGIQKEEPVPFKDEVLAQKIGLYKKEKVKS